jgi:DNA-binding CsgD family transcriptional regulator
MRSIVVVFNENGDVVYQNCAGNAQELFNTFCEEGVNQEQLGLPPPVQVKDLVILAEGSQKPKRNAPKLTARQCLVLQCLANSLSLEQSALKMGVSVNTIHNYLKILKKKFNTESRDQLMAMAGYLGLCDPFQNEKNNKS